MAYFLLLAGGVYLYYNTLLWETEPSPNAVPEEDAYAAPVKVMALPGRGMGVVAARDISVSPAAL